jgi:hypothetical protein
MITTYFKRQAKLNAKSKLLAQKAFKTWKLFVKLKIYKRKLLLGLFERWTEKLSTQKRAIWRDGIRSKIHLNYVTFSSSWKLWQDAYQTRCQEKKKLDLAVGYANVLLVRNCFDSLLLYCQLRSKKKELKGFASERASMSTRSAFFHTWRKKACITKKQRRQHLEESENLTYQRGSKTLKSTYLQHWKLGKYWFDVSCKN